MKKLIYIVGLLLITTTCFSQSIVNRANSSYTVQDSRFSAALNLYVPRYADTTAANLAVGIDSLASIIYTYDVQSFWGRQYSSGKRWVALGSGGGGSGTVTSVGWTGGIVSIANPTTTPAFTIAGTSGGIPYFSSSSTWATSAALAANSLVIGGGAGTAPSSITTGTGILTALGVNIGSAGAPVLFDGAGGTPSSMTGTNITGTASGLSIGGNAATATILQTARNIQGVSFNGSANIDIINGTGFVKATGTTITYDNSTYLTSVFLPVTGTGTATGAIIGSLAGNTVNIQQGANSFLSIDPTANAEAVNLQAFNTTAGDNYAGILGSTSDVTASGSLAASFDGDSKIAFITATANVTDATLAYNADTHTFTGFVGIGVTPTELLQVQVAGFDLLEISPTGDESYLYAYDPTGDINVSGIRSVATATDAQSEFAASYQGLLISNIVTFADATVATIAYNAANGHTFTGNILPVSDNSTDIGSASAAFKDFYGRTLHLDGSTSGSVTVLSDALGNAINGTTLTGTGAIWSTSGVYLVSDFTLADVNTAQSVLPTASDVITVQASTTYRFKGRYAIQTGGGNVTVAMGFALSSATITSMRYGFISVIAADGSSSTAQTMGNGVGVASIVVTATSASAARSIEFEGIIRINAGGTITPQITFSAAPGGTNLLKADSYIEFTPIGTNTIAAIGPEA